MPLLNFSSHHCLLFRHFLYVSKEMLHTIFFPFIPFSLLARPLLFLTFSLLFAFCVEWMLLMGIHNELCEWDRFFFLCAQSFCVYLCYWFNIWSHLIPLSFRFISDYMYISIWLSFYYCLRDNCLIAQETKLRKSFFIFFSFQWQFLSDFTLKWFLRGSWDDILRGLWSLWRFREN